MPLVIECASCGKKVRVKDELAGKKVKCPCGGVIAVPAAGPAEEELPPAVTRRKKERDKAGCDFWVYRFAGANVLALDGDGFWYAAPDKEAAERIGRDLEEGVGPEEALGEAGKFIPFASVSDVSTNLKAKSITVNYKSEDKDASETWWLETQDQRDEVFDAIRRRLGSGFRYQRKDLSHLQAALAPLGTIVVLAGLTAFCVFLAWAFEQPSDGGSRVVRTNLWGLLLAYTVGFLGITGTSIIGGLCIALTAVWMVVRVANPPIEVTLKPEEGARPRKKRPKAEEE